MLYFHDVYVPFVSAIDSLYLCDVVTCVKTVVLTEPPDSTFTPYILFVINTYNYN